MQRRSGRASARSLARVQQTGMAWVSVCALRGRHADKGTVMRTGRRKAKAARQSAGMWRCVCGGASVFKFEFKFLIVWQPAARGR